MYNRPIKLPTATFNRFKSKSNRNKKYKSIKVIAKWKTRVVSKKIGWLGTSIRECTMTVWNADRIGNDFEMTESDPAKYTFIYAGLNFYVGEDEAKEIEHLQERTRDMRKLS